VKKEDTVAPITNINFESSSLKIGDWYTSDVTVSLSSKDESGVEKTLYKINNGDWDKYTEDFKIQNEGSTIIEFKSIDKNGNEENVKSETVKIDKKAPSTTASDVIRDWTNKSVQLELAATDEISGVTYTEYRINNGEWVKYTGPISVKVEGKNLIEYRSVDNAGNTEEIKSLEVKLDQTAPETTVSPVKDGWYNSDVTLNLEYEDSLSGVAKT
jgi:hypothetical protein